MPKIILESRENLIIFCKNKCLDIRNLYEKYVNCIEDHNATIKIEYRFLSNGKYNKHNVSGSQIVFLICVHIYPKQYSENLAKRANVYQSYYSKAGIIKKNKNSAYQLNINEREDIGMTLFFRKYAKQIVKMPAKIALKHRLSDFLLHIIIPKRIGSSLNKTYRNFQIYQMYIIILIIILFVLRLLIPKGYRPSLR